jgi:hypothetical protein
MNPAELRIGNYFQPTKKVKGLDVPFGVVGVIQTLLFECAEWVTIDQVPAQVETWSRSIYTEMQPIPLTEEWLLKVGFRVLDKEGYHNELYIIERAVFGDNRWSFRVKTSETKSVGVKYFHYVHQLQNLYFALTGEELTLKKEVALPNDR